MNDNPIPLLQKRDKNKIIAAIRAVGLDPREFDLDDSSTEVRIRHRRSNWLFVVGGTLAHYVGRYTFAEGLDRPYEAFRSDALMSHINQWLELVKNDLDTPDLWAELQREAQLLGAGSSAVTDNTPFTPDEQREIAGRLDKLREYVSDTHSLSKAQIQALEEKLDYLVDASARLGRKDWLNIFIGVILGFVFTTALAPESARTIFTTFLRGIGLLYPELPLIE